MEIEAKEIGLDERLQYLTQISENQQAHKTPFSWGTAIVFLCIGIGIGVLIVIGARKSDKKEDSK